MMRVAFFEVKDWERDYLRQRLPGAETHFEAQPIEAGRLEAVRGFDYLSVFIYSRVNAEVLAALPSLRMVATRSTGFDHVDLDACRARGIRVANVPTYGENTVAEHTFAIILMLARRIHDSIAQVRSGHIERANLTGFDLQGKTIGVVGAGRIGLHVIRIARGFGMRVLAFDTRRDPFLGELMSFEYCDLDRLLETCDILSLHCPLNAATRHVIGAGQFARMKRGALFINTSRGGLVDTDALIAALDSGHLAGAGLDVLEGEELIKEEKELLYAKQDVEVAGELARQKVVPKLRDELARQKDVRTALRNRILLERENVIFTPHNAFNSHEALVRILDTTLANLAAHRDGQPVNCVC